MGDPVTDPGTLAEAARRGDRVALAKLLTWVERGPSPDADAGIGADGAASWPGAIEDVLGPFTGGARTVGITGAPGAGKSTLTSALVAVARERGERVAVLAVDPSSPRTGGAILGDRVRMGSHTLDPDVFIRSMATRGSFGGLAKATPDAVRVLDAVGYSCIVIETVGVGQVEVDVAATAATTVVVVNPGWGDSVQVAKAGLMEVADVFVVNKADRPGADEARRDLDRLVGTPSGWRPPVLATVATTGEGVPELWDAITEHGRHPRPSR